MIKTHEQGIAAAEAFAQETGLPMCELRRVAAMHLSEQWAEQGIVGEGMGTSDVSIHLASMFNYDLEEFLDRIRPLVLLAKAAKGAGRTYEEYRDLARRMFEPA